MSIIRELEEALLAAKIDEELAEPKWSTRTHGTLSCYNSGCRGPLCGYINRVRQRTSTMEPDNLESIIIERTRVHQRARVAVLTHQRRGMQ